MLEATILTMKKRLNNPKLTRRQMMRLQEQDALEDLPISRLEKYSEEDMSGLST